MYVTHDRRVSEEEEKLVSQDIVKKWSNELLQVLWREKHIEIVYKYPYRKPTQVDEERILRRTGEALLRNSAKWPRNFGIRGADVKVSRREKSQATV